MLALNDRHEWELPGGRIEVGERVTEALEREFKEELAVEVVALGIIDSYLFGVIPGKHVFIVTYGVKLVGKFAPTLSHEHTQLATFAVNDLPTNLPTGYAGSIKAWYGYISQISDLT